jgi:hypothetical protein
VVGFLDEKRPFHRNRDCGPQMARRIEKKKTKKIKREA